MKIMISAGEVSGDIRGAEVLRELKKNSQEKLFFRGMGGGELEREGMILDVDLRQTGNVMGFFDVLKSAPKILNSLKVLKKVITDFKPEVLLLIDYPDFNLRLAKFAKAEGVKVIYYIPPKIWAWRSSRINLLKKYTDKIGTIFPFEPKYYQERGYQQCYYVGHPLIKEVEEKRLNETEKVLLKRELGISERDLVLAVFIGSRRGEIERHLETILSAILKIQQKITNVTPLFVFNDKKLELSDQISKKIPSAKFIYNNSIQALSISNFGILKSGTCNLEAALLKVPFVVVYKTTKFNYFMAKNFVKLKEASPVNILKANSIRELIQEYMTADSVEKEMVKLISDNQYRTERVNNLEDVISVLKVKDKDSCSLINLIKT